MAENQKLKCGRFILPSPKTFRCVIFKIQYGALDEMQSVGDRIGGRRWIGPKSRTRE